MEKTVLLLGAGASRASRFRLPTMEGFFDGLQVASDLSAFLTSFTSGHLSRANLEEVLSYLDLSRGRERAWGLARPAKSPDPGFLYDTVIAYTRSKLSIPPGESCKAHEWLISQLGEQDTIISLNYDLVCDQSLFTLEPKTDKGHLLTGTRLGKLRRVIADPLFWGGQPPALMPSETKTGFFLKLHGSLDWLVCPTPGCPNSTVVFSLLFEQLADGQEEGLPCRYCGSAIKTLIVPPILSKRLTEPGRIAFIWNLALRELTAATKVTVVGLSFAASDFELRWLIRKAAEIRGGPIRTLVVVNPEPAHRTAAVRLLSSENTEVHQFDTLDALIAGHRLLGDHTIS